MKLTTLARIIFVVCHGIAAAKAVAQTNDSLTAAMEKNALHAYHNFLSPETGLYNGREYVDYSGNIKDGDPFFMTKTFMKGSIVYDGILYNNVPVLYDLVTSDVVITDSSFFFRIKLNQEKISWFTVMGHNFLRLYQDSNKLIKEGFYDQLYNGHIQLYKKHVKHIQESVTMDGIRRYISQNIDYYIKRGNEYYHANTKKELLNVMKDKKKELTAFIRKNKLDMRRNKEEAFKAVAAYYDQLTHQ